MPKRFCDGFLLQRYNPSQCHFSQKTALHAMHSYDRMCLWWHFARRGFLLCCQRTKGHTQTPPLRGFAPTAQSATLLPQKTVPARHVRLRPDVSAAIILCAGASPRYQRAKNHTQAPLRQDFVATLQSAAARFPRKPPRHAMRSYDQMHPLSPIARHILPFSASLSAWEARCDRICVQGGGRSPIASSILFRRDGHFAQVLRKSGVLLGTPAANE